MARRKTRQKYDFAFKEKAVLLSYERPGMSLAKLEKELGLYTAALSTWRREYEKFNTGEPLGNNYLKLNLERQKNHEIEKKTKKTELKFEILKNGLKYLTQGRPAIFQFMAGNEKIYSIRLMCEVLGLNRGTYRTWKKQVVTEKQKRKIEIQKEITSRFYAFEQRYGCKRIAVALQNDGFKISRDTVHKHMRELGLASKVKKN